MNELGERVSYFRKKKGYTIKELALNLCDESTLYRLEQKKQVPRIEILVDICLRLEIPLKALFPINEEVDRLKKLCREAVYTKDYLQLELLLESSDIIISKINSFYVKEEFKKFIQWHKGIMLQKRDKRDLDSLLILNSLVNINNCSSELDINIMNSIGLIYLSMNEINAADRIYREIYPKVLNIKNIEDLTIRPRVGYNCAYTLYKTSDFHEALEVITECLFYLESHQMMYSLGKVYHLKGLLSEKCGYIKEAIEDFQNAILVFTLTKEQSNLLRTKEDLADIVADNYETL